MSQTYRIMDLDANNIRKVQEMQDDNTCRKYMIPEGMEPSEDRLSLPSMKWRLSEDDSPEEKKKYFYEKAKNYRFNINDLHKYS